MSRPYLLFLLMLLSFASLAELEVENATIRLLPPSVPNTAAYFMLKNNGVEGVSIIGAESSIAEKVELHAHIMKNEVMSMVKQNELWVDAGETIHFQPGGYHLMMFGLKKPLEKNEVVDIHLMTNKGENLTFSAIVKEPSAQNSKHQH